MKKYPIAFRLTKAAQELIDQLAEYLGISKTAIVEMSIRELARKEELYHASPESTQDTAESNA
mgnify:CR=1 FL=1|jgi:predicted transcriptional regulator